MRYRILGPVEVWADGSRVAVGGPQQRALLAVLLLNANQVVSADRLVSELWREPPPAARRLLQGCVVRLRRALGHRALVSSPPGYLVEVGPGELDLDRFEELVAAAEPLRGNAFDEAAALLGEALALWRGPALDGVGTDVCQTQARSLDERRQAVLEDLVDVDLHRGRHAELVGELRALVRVHPLRERLWAQLMLALHGAGRQADALAAYRELRDTLVEQLGIEPDVSVQNVERAILAGGDALAAYQADEATPVVPAQLPAAVAAFTGRAEHVKELDARPDDTGSVAIVAIDGMAGVGKTALAVHWAQQVRGRFPDGQLYLNLRGYAPADPMTPLEALTEFLLALGVPAKRIPAETDRAAARFRSLVADRRLLVLLDNAHSADQVRPLLPAGPGCLVLVTSRDRLSGLVARDGAHRLTLDVLTRDEATRLLERIVGRQRVDAEPEAVTELSRACGSLPLALRVAAAVVTDAPHRTIAWYVRTLDETGRLSSLAVDGDEQAGVRAAFDLSYAALTRQAQRTFCLLGLVPGPDVTVQSTAAVTGATTAEARRLLHRLTAAHLIEEHTPDRFTFHDLLRVYALERAEADQPAIDRKAAVQRLHDWYLHTADGASRLLYPEKTRLAPPETTSTSEFTDHLAAANWLHDERAGLVAAVRQAAANGPHPSAWRLADALRGYLWGHGHWVDWLAVATAAHAAAEAGGDLRARAATHLSLADAHRCRNRYPRAVGLYTRAVALSREAGWQTNEAAALGNLGVTFWEMGSLDQAADRIGRALAINHADGNRIGHASNLSNLGLVYQDFGWLDRAGECFSEALSLDRELGLRASEGVDLAHLGLVECLKGQLEKALELHVEALAIQRELGNRHLEAATLRQLALVHRDAGRHEEAMRAACTALSLAHESGTLLIEANTLATLGAIHHGLGRHAQAIDHHEQALRLGRRINAPAPQIEAMLGLAAAHEPEHGLHYAERALALADRHDYRLWEERALTTIAQLRLLSPR